MGGGRDIGRLPVLAFDVHEHGSPGQVFKDVPGLDRVHLPDLGRLFERERFDGQDGNELGFALGKEDSQDFVQGFGGGSSLRAAVQPVGQFGITRTMRMVRHFSSFFLAGA